jgi:superfamily II DNA/RNA helicase
MYDPNTASLIEGSPPLEGLDTSTLAREMTRDYAEIVSLRVRFHETQKVKKISGKFRRRLRRLELLANTYEAYVALLPDKADRNAAAFVSASAHHLLAIAAEARGSPRPSLHRDGISPAVSAMLLFLISGHPADAAEMVKWISTDGLTEASSALLRAGQCLAAGRLPEILNAAQPMPPGIAGTPSWDLAATDVLWYRLLHACRHLASNLLGEPAITSAELEAEILAVGRDSVSQFSLDGHDGQDDAMAGYYRFAGPHHLATLLWQVARELLLQAVVNSPYPQGIDARQWGFYLKSLARRRPYMWPNHVAAMKTGYMHNGTSAVISFPTGAGKSALAEFKIAVELLGNRRVLYLIPTHALAAQVSADLRKAFPDARIRRSFLGEGQYAEVDDEKVPDIAVMTPERCLALAGIDPDAFADLGLLVFDECHLLHPRAPGNDRRSLDAMLCLLQVTRLAPKADILMLSAMIRNVDELAGWLTELLGRQCLALKLEWKPTRQARGCVLFSSDRIHELQALLRADRSKAKSTDRKAPGVEVKRQLSAQPFGLFCLRQTWHTVAETDYSLLPLLKRQVMLEANKGWYLLPNKNHVAALLAAHFGKAAMKCIVFTQSRIHCQAIAEQAATVLAESYPAVEMNELEKELLEATVQEMGGIEHVIPFFDGRAVCHHGLLLPMERHLSESLFARADGARVLAATPTLAQGMNLPAEVVIIAGDERFDQTANEMQRLEAHELLNAAGRAGRAGQVAQGIVLVIPGTVVDFDDKRHLISDRWFDLQKRVFSQSDQCLDVTDPVDGLLDAIQQQSNAELCDVDYFFRRLPRDSDDSSARELLNRSLAAYHAKLNGKTDEFNTCIEVALTARRAAMGASHEIGWQEAIASGSGTPIAAIEQLAEQIQQPQNDLPSSTGGWVNWFFDWLSRDATRLSLLVRNSAIEKFLSGSGAPTAATVAALRDATLGWMGGATLRELEGQFGTPVNKLRQCDKARDFVIRSIPEISFAVGLVAQIYRELTQHGELESPMPLALATVAACVREGQRSPEALAVRYRIGPLKSRAACQSVLSTISDSLDPGDPLEEFAITLRRVGAAMRHEGLI